MNAASGAGPHIPAGGPATINGVLYQMLWTLLHVSKARLAEQPVMKNGQIQQVTFLLEPKGGGGDLVVTRNSRRTVEQVKARSDGGTWSLREVVEKVIPDLYIATLKDKSPTDYRFVTEGRMGKWADEYAFFQSISPSDPTEDPLEDIDDTSPFTKKTRKSKRIKKARTQRSQTSGTAKGSFWKQESYTKRSLFIQIVTEVRKRKVVFESETERETQRHLRDLLKHFTFVGEQQSSQIQTEIDTLLLAVVTRNEDIPQIRDSLAMELARRATNGNADIECRALLESKGLDSTPITDWTRMLENAALTTQRYLEIRQYNPARDVRIRNAANLLQLWPKDIPVLVVTGESGSGKSWMSYAIYHLAQSRQAICAMVSAADSPTDTLARAARQIWVQIAGHDSEIPLSQISRRVRQVLRNPPKPWLTLIVDDVPDREHALQLIRNTWEDWAVRLIITVGKRDWTAIESDVGGRCWQSTVDHFSNEELQDYLHTLLGERWPAVPEFMRGVLRVPVIADIFRRITEGTEDQEWTPTSEYEVLNKFWQRVLNSEPADHSVLLRLADRYLAEGMPKWPVSALTELGADGNTITRLERLGWLRIVPTQIENHVEFTHQRLLNWACATAIVARERKSYSIEALCDDLEKFLKASQPFGTTLSFVPMDVLWLMLEMRAPTNTMANIIASFTGDYYTLKAIYEELLPTLGARVIDSVLGVLRTVINDRPRSSLAIVTLARIGGNRITIAAIDLLHDDNNLLKLCACDLLRQFPSASVLDPLWILHKSCLAKPSAFLRGSEHQNDRSLRNRVLPALIACAKLQPDWLINAIDVSDLNNDPVADLAHIISQLNPAEGRTVWRKSKAKLFQCLAEDHHRILAASINKFCDWKEIDWLKDRLADGKFVGITAAAALARIQPLDVLENLHRIPLSDFIIFRNSVLDTLSALEPNATRESLFTLLTRSDHPWDVAGAYSERFHFADGRFIERLLNDFGETLARYMARSDCGEVEPPGREIALLAEAKSLAQLEILRRSSGSSLERNLVDLVCQIGEPSWADNFSLRTAVSLLFRMSGDGFTRVANRMLTADSIHVRLKAIGLAGRRPNTDTFSLLSEIVTGSKAPGGNFIERSIAAVTLAIHGVWEPVVEYVRSIPLDALDGLDGFPLIEGLPHRGCRPPFDLLVATAEELRRNPSVVNIGDVILLGFGPPEFGAVVRQVAAVCEPGSDVAHACVRSLGMLADNAPESVRFLRTQLPIVQRRRHVLNALIRNGTAAAMESLENCLEGDFAAPVIINLVQHSGTRTQIISRITASVERAVSGKSSWRYGGTLRQVVEGIQDASLAATILSNGKVKEYLLSEAFCNEGPFWMVGSKYSAIKCLSYIDSERALLAAKAAIQNEYAHDRELYPSVIAELDPITAADFLMNLLLREASEKVRQAICRVIRRIKGDAVVVKAMLSGDTGMERAGCVAAGWLEHSDELIERLKTKIGSSEPSVSMEAVASISRLARDKECSGLIRLICESSDRAEQWVYLISLLELADCGDDQGPWPACGSPIADVLSPLQLCFLEEELQKRRKTAPHR